MFIELKIDKEKCIGPESCQLCLQNCPVDIFILSAGEVTVNHKLEDECTLCDLCLDKCPTHAIVLTKLY